MTQESTAPVWRERVQLSHTIKDGWRVSEVTVEVTYTDDDYPSRRAFQIDRQVRIHQAVVDGNLTALRVSGVDEGWTQQNDDAHITKMPASDSYAQEK